jgi:hypothetical protein
MAVTATVARAARGAQLSLNSRLEKVTGTSVASTSAAGLATVVTQSLRPSLR